MRVIVEGRVQAKGRIMCSNCGCVFEYDADDVKEDILRRTTLDPMLGIFANQQTVYKRIKWVKCPTPKCGEQHVIEKSESTAAEFWKQMQGI